MLIIMRTTATREQIDGVVTRVEAYGLRVHLSPGTERVIIGAVGDGRAVNQDEFAALPGVDRVVPISRPYKLASREYQPENTRFRLGEVEVGSGELLIIAGPCSVESRSQTLEVAHAVRAAGAHALRGGAFKPRSSPYSFQGLGEVGLEILAEARAQTGLPVISEVMAPEQVPLLAGMVDVLQVGARNMQNFPLLHAVGESGLPVLLKRGLAATVEELLMAAEYILSHGNGRVMLCERGIRTFETATRNTTDINAIPAIHELSHLPVLIDPSHSTGRWEYVAAVARAGVAAGADGLMVEVHAHPREALSDGAQSLKPERFASLVAEVRAVAGAIGRSVPGTAGHSVPGTGGHSVPGTAGRSLPGTAGHSLPGTAGHSVPGTAGHSVPGSAGHSVPAPVDAVREAPR